MKYKNFLIRLFDLILVLGLLAGYQAVIYSRDKEATIAELKSQVNQLQGEKEDILEAAKNSGKLGTDGVSAGQAGTYLFASAIYSRVTIYSGLAGDALPLCHSDS